MRAFIIICFVFSIKALSSQNQDTLKTNLQKELQEVVITGQFTETAIEDAVHKIRVIDNKTLNSGIFNDLSSVLEKEANMKLSQDNILGAGISIQGISGQNVKILINDIPVIGRLNGNVDLSQINLNNVERIEIIEGPLSTIYGTDALAGTINIITKKTLDYKNILNTYYESIGKYNLDLMLAREYKKQQLKYQFGRKYFNGWSEGQAFSLLPQSMPADTNRKKQWKPKEQFSHILSYNLNKGRYNISNSLEGFYEKITNKGMPREPYFESAFDEYYYTYRTNLNSDIKIKNKENDFKILLAYNRYNRIKRTLYNDLTSLSTTLVNDPSAQDTSIFELMLIKTIISNYQHEKIKYQLGVDIQYQTAQGQRILHGNQNQNNYAAFSTIEYLLNKNLTLRPSGRLIHNSNYNAPFIPAFNILYDFNKYKIRASYAKGFRAPDFKELFLNFVDINHNIVGNSLLLAEESDNYNLNIAYKNNLFRSIIKTDLSVFYNRIYNKIDLYSSPLNSEQYSYFNIEEYTTKGGSLNASCYFKKFELNVGASHIGSFNKLSETYNSPQYTYSTDYSISTLVYINTTSKLNLFYKYTGETPSFNLIDNNIVESFSQSYKMMDLSLNKTMFNNIISLTIGAKNLFDVKNIIKNSTDNSVHSSNNNKISIGYGRSYFIRLNFRL